jgi:hypothetical protein
MGLDRCRVSLSGAAAISTELKRYFLDIAICEVSLGTAGFLLSCLLFDFGLIKTSVGTVPAIEPLEK